MLARGQLLDVRGVSLGHVQRQRVLDARVLELPSGVAPALGRAVLVHPPADARADAGADVTLADEVADNVALTDAGRHAVRALSCR